MPIEDGPDNGPLLLARGIFEAEEEDAAVHHPPAIHQLPEVRVHGDHEAVLPNGPLQDLPVGQVGIHVTHSENVVPAFAQQPLDRLPNPHIDDDLQPAGYLSAIGKTCSSATRSAA